MVTRCNSAGFILTLRYMDSAEIRRRFLKFFEERGHAIVPSSSLIPDDPSVLLTTAGMQQFKQYYTGELDAVKDFGSKNTASIQKSFRTSDIDEIGDETHNTFFEMLGSFSFGGYWKKEAIAWAHEFLTNELGLSISYVVIFKGSSLIPKDGESERIWHSLGVMDVREGGMDDVFWGPTGTSGPCGPTTDIYCKAGDGREVENWSIVFNEFFCSGSREELRAGKAELTPLKTRGIDTGMGLERLAMVAQKKGNIFETDLFAPLARALPENLSTRTKRIAVDHGRAMAFLISDGVRPSNKESGYILRRLMRRTMVHEHLSGTPFMENILKEVCKHYRAYYSELNVDLVTGEFNKEKERFQKTLVAGLKELKKIPIIDTTSAFRLYETYGLPYEIITELGGTIDDGLTREAFNAEFKKHQELSRAGATKKFGGHGLVLDTGELKAGSEEEMQKVLRLHTATHLLQQALREVLGPDVHQMGSDITPERTRFDFSFPRKMTPEEIKKAEEIVNQKIGENLLVGFREMPKSEAEKLGALHFFKEKYPEKVKVYYVGSDLAHAWSKEFCGGPHVAHTGEIGHFRIAKEEAVGSGIRRIRGMLDD